MLQVQKVRNVTAPKANEESQHAPRMLKITLTDGFASVNLLEMTLLNQVGFRAFKPNALSIGLLF